MNCLCFNNNCYLWLLIIMLILCCCKNGCVNDIIEKICGCGPLIPVILFMLCACNGNGEKCQREPKGFPGCNCK